MNTPADPYNSASNRPFEDDPFLAPISEEEKEKDAGFNFADDVAAADEAERKRAEQAAWENSFAQVDQARKEQLAAPDANRSLADVAQGKPGVDSPVHDAVFAENLNRPQRTSVLPANSVNEFVDDSFAAPRPDTASGVETNRERHDRWAQDPGDINEIESAAATSAASSDAVAADYPEKVPSRAGAHVLSLLLSLLLMPVVWHLLSDAAMRLFSYESSPWETGVFQLFPLVELLGGLAALTVLAAVAMRSALGPMLWGGGVFIAGTVFLAMPAYSAQLMKSLTAAIGDFNPFTSALSEQLAADLGSGRIATFGCAVFLFGLVAAVARRRGAKRAQLIAHIEGNNAS
ncbi:MAG: hypothetical protein Q4E03_01295 [Trueperella sp.]|nr:hypothetical protein [Trueperella sp.]